MKERKENHWLNLPTVTTFDKGMYYKFINILYISVVYFKLLPFLGKNLLSTNRLNKDNLLEKVSLSSILIGSLINQLCTILEKDPGQRKKLYFCKYLPSFRKMLVKISNAKYKIF